jgi:hypothetical protein
MGEWSRPESHNRSEPEVGITLEEAAWRSWWLQKANARALLEAVVTR